MEYIKIWIHDFLSVFNRELKLMMHDGGFLIIILFTGIVYPFLYYHVYKNGVMQDTPLAVVDKAKCADSRRYIREVNATPECNIDFECTDMEEAKELMRQRKVHGIIYIPSDYGDNLVHGQTATVGIYADMSSFLYYKNVLMSSELPLLHEINHIQIDRYAAEGATDAEAYVSAEPVVYEALSPYNRSLSYTIFIYSMILLMIVQQVMFYGMSLVSGTMREEGKSFAALKDSFRGAGVGRIVLGRGAAYWLLFMVMAINVTLIAPALLGFPQRGRFADIIWLDMVFVTSCVFFCEAWSSLIYRRETVFVLFLTMTFVCVFLTGFAWPRSSFPPFWKAFSCLFPTSFGCRAFINVNTAGADLPTVAPLLKALVLQGSIYFVLACVAVYIENFVLRHKKTIPAGFNE